MICIYIILDTEGCISGLARTFIINFIIFCYWDTSVASDTSRTVYSSTNKFTCRYCIYKYPTPQSAVATRAYACFTLTKQQISIVTVWQRWRCLLNFVTVCFVLCSSLGGHMICAGDRYGRRRYKSQPD